MTSNSNGSKAIVRQDFLRRFVKVDGITYEKAAEIYEAMVGLFADAIVTGEKITIGHVMAIKPHKRKARKVSMGFGGVKKTIYLSGRIAFKVSVYRKFLDKHELNWKL